MTIVIDGALEKMLRQRLATWREADERYRSLTRPGVDPSALADAMRDVDAKGRPLVLLLSVVVE